MACSDSPAPWPSSVPHAPPGRPPDGGSAPGGANRAWVDLFDGRSLSGWEQLNGTARYSIEDGAIVGRTEPGSWNAFLCTTKSYRDFELTFEVNVQCGLNGVQIRSAQKPDTTGEGKNNEKGRVYGPQVEIECGGQNGAEAGYVYGEATSWGWLTPPERLKPHLHHKDGQWNSYRVMAKGPRIQTWINGTPIGDLTDARAHQAFPAGFIGLQEAAAQRLETARVAGASMPFRWAASLPMILLVVFGVIWLRHRARGGYRVVLMNPNSSQARSRGQTGAVVVVTIENRRPYAAPVEK